MAQVEPMDIDAIESDFDNKENAFHYNNVLSRTPCTEKGYEELDVSELNMKLRYSITPASSPMSKSLTAQCLDNRNCNSEDYLNNAIGAENGNLTRSLNSTLTKTEGLSKSKILPLKTLSADPFVDSNRSSSIHRLLDPNDNTVVISVNNANDIDENLSLPSTCSSVPDTPEATTPTKEIPKPEGSPIMRGLKSVLSMFRPSQSPILPADDKSTKLDVLGPVEFNKSEVETVQVSTPVAANNKMDGNSSKRSSPLKESLVFNDDLERELLWKDETTIIFKEEKIPVHKLFFQNPITDILPVPKALNATVEHMDISCDENFIVHKSHTSHESSEPSVKNEHVITGESDNEFLDCENTFTKNECYLSDNNKLEVCNETKLSGNITVEPPSNTGTSKENNSEADSVLNNTGGVTSGEIIISTDKASVSGPDFAFKINESNINYESDINEATKKLLSSESNYNTIGLENKSIVNKELHLEKPNVSISINEQGIKDDGLTGVNEDKSFETLNMKHDNLVMCQSQYQTFYNTDKESDIAADSLNCINYIRDESSKTPDTNEPKEITSMVEDMADTVKDTHIVTDNPGRDVYIEGIDEISSVPNNHNPNMINKFGSTLEMESNIDLLTTEKVKTFVTDNEVSVTNNSVIDIVNVDSISSDDHKMIKNKLEINDIPVQTDIAILFDNKILNNAANNSDNFKGNLNVDHKIIEDILVTQVTKAEEDMPIKTSISSINNESTAETICNHQLNNANIDSKSTFHEVNISNKSSDGNIGDLLKTKKESFSLQINSDANVDSKIDDNMKTSHIIVSSNAVVNNITDNDREISELITGSVITISKSLSEIPLPDEDDIEQNILKTHDKYKEDCYKQDIPTDVVCEKDSIMVVESELLIDNTKCNKVDVTLNPIEQNESNIQSIGIKTLTSEHSTEIMDQDKVIFDIQIAENSVVPEENSKGMSVPENIYNSTEKNTLQIQISKSTENKIIEKVTTNTEEISSVTEEDSQNTKRHENIHILDKFNVTNQKKMSDDNQEELTSAKEVNEIGEDIITSANNSPYVSVTDLDVVPEKIVTHSFEGIDTPFVTNSKLGTSPPISPKIVSKGYNFNFDEIDDPFATKTKIRMSPTPDTPNQSFDTISKDKKPDEMAKKVTRRKSQSEKKRPIPKKSMNSKFTDKLAGKESKSEKHINSAMITTKDNSLDNISTPSVKEILSKCKPDNCDATVSHCQEIYEKVDDSSSLEANQISTPFLKEETQSNDEGIKSSEQTLVISTEKSTSSSEQYFSLGTSSGDSSGLMNRSKNVFNLPEIDDVNFNPFATKSKIRMSSPTAEELTNPIEDKSDVTKSCVGGQQHQSDNDTITNKTIEITSDNKMKIDLSPNISNTTSYSMHTNDIDSTVREIHTEDEDTVEGPFLEVDDLTDIQKLTAMKVDTDMMNFEEIPQQERDLENGELFIDADAFEFLLNQNKSTTVLDSGKESLFLKFDPLFAKRVSSDGILAALSKIQERQSTPKKVIKPTQKDLPPVEKSTAGPSNDNGNYGSIEEYNGDVSSTMTKPMMVVNPAVSSINTQKKSATPKLNRRSLTFTSPAMAVIDRLLSLSGNSSHLENNTSIPQIGREHSETDLAITQLRELLAEKEINVHSLRSESKALKDRLAALEVQVRGLETESAKRLGKINELNERLLEKSKMNKSMAIVVEEYERTIASLIAETEQDKKRNAEERMKLIKERDEQTAHLTSMEVSFSDLHSKYEKSKQIILSCKANEDIYKKSIKEFQDNFSKMQNNYELLKQHATSKLNHANQELEKMNRAHEAEVLKMNAMIKRKELHITSLEETLAQKTKANEELTAICDELINKVG